MKKQVNAERRERFESLVASGLSTAKAAAAVGISVSTGFAWAQSVRGPGERKRKSRTVHFAQLIPRSAVTSPMQIEVAGVTIKLDANFDDHALARLIRVARGAQ